MIFYFKLSKNNYLFIVLLWQRKQRDYHLHLLIFLKKY